MLVPLCAAPVMFFATAPAVTPASVTESPFAKPWASVVVTVKVVPLFDALLIACTGATSLMAPARTTLSPVRNPLLGTVTVTVLPLLAMAVIDCGFELELFQSVPVTQVCLTAVCCAEEDSVDG